MTATDHIAERLPVPRPDPETTELIAAFNFALRQAAEARRLDLPSVAGIYDDFADGFADRLLQRPDYLALIAEGGAA